MIKKSLSVVVRTYNIAKCFYVLKQEEVVNSLYEAGLGNNKLKLLYLTNENKMLPTRIHSKINIVERE